MNRELPLGDPLFDGLAWLFWFGLPAEVTLNWTHLYEVHVWQSHLPMESVVRRWVVFVLVNMGLWVLIAMGLGVMAERWRRSRSKANHL